MIAVGFWKILGVSFFFFYIHVIFVKSKGVILIEK